MPRDLNPAADNIRAIIELERQAARESSPAERFAHRISTAIGTPAFVLVQMLAMAAWMGWNVFLPASGRFDPYPFGLLTFIVSLEGVLIATFVLIAQNQMSRHTEERDHLDLQISLLAEQEMTLMLKQLRRISDRLGIPPQGGDEGRAERLAQETNVYELVHTLRRELPEIEKE